MVVILGTGLRISIATFFTSLGQIGRVWCRDVRFADDFFAVGFGESRIWEAGPRLEERGCARVAGAVDPRHGGAALFAGIGSRCGRG